MGASPDATDAETPQMILRHLIQGNYRDDLQSCKHRALNLDESEWQYLTISENRNSDAPGPSTHHRAVLHLNVERVMVFLRTEGSIIKRKTKYKPLTSSA